MKDNTNKNTNKQVVNVIVSDLLRRKHKKKRSTRSSSAYAGSTGANNVISVNNGGYLPPEKGGVYMGNQISSLPPQQAEPPQQAQPQNAPIDTGYIPSPDVVVNNPNPNVPIMPYFQDMDAQNQANTQDQIQQNVGQQINELRTRMEMFQERGQDATADAIRQELNSMGVQVSPPLAESSYPERVRQPSPTPQVSDMEVSPAPPLAERVRQSPISQVSDMEASPTVQNPESLQRVDYSRPSENMQGFQESMRNLRQSYEGMALNQQNRYADMFKQLEEIKAMKKQKDDDELYAKILDESIERQNNQSRSRERSPYQQNVKGEEISPLQQVVKGNPVDTSAGKPDEIDTDALIKSLMKMKLNEGESGRSDAQIPSLTRSEIKWANRMAGESPAPVRNLNDAFSTAATTNNDTQRSYFTELDQTQLYEYKQLLGREYGASNFTKSQIDGFRKWSYDLTNRILQSFGNDEARKQAFIKEANPKKTYKQLLKVYEKYITPASTSAG